MEAILAILAEALSQFIIEYAKYEIRRKFDAAGNAISEIVAVFDDDGDGVADREEVLCQFDVTIPDLSDGYCIVNKDDEIGIGLPQYELVDSTDMADMLPEVITGNDDGYLIDGDVYVPLPFDYTGDGVNDWGKVVDSDSNGVPDASPDAPFYPVGSDGYNDFLSRYKNNDGVDLVVVSPEGEIAIYDRNGNIKAEDVDTAYATWVSKNGIMDKQLDNYSVSEGLLLCLLLISGVFFIRSLFKRKDVFK